MGRAKTKKNNDWNLNSTLQGVSEAVKSMSNKTQEAVIDAWEEIEHERRRELLAIPLIAFSLISLLALVSYTPNDIAAPALAEPGQVIQNWVGKPGAWLADLIIFSFGAAGYSLPALFLLWGVDRLRNGADVPVRKYRILGFILLLISTSSLLGLLSPGASEESLWRICGALGFTLNRRINEFGPLGAMIVNVALLAISALLCTPLLFSDLYHRLACFFFPPEVEEDEEYDEDEDYYDEDEDEDYIDEEEDDYVDEEDEEVEPETKSSRLPSLAKIFSSFKKQEKKPDSGFALQPLRERDESETAEDWEEEEEDCGLPPLTEKPSGRKKIEMEPLETSEAEEPMEIDAGLPDLQMLEDKELKIVTREDEPIKEVSMGVNLITTPTQENYQLPPLTLLIKPEQTRSEVAREEIVHKSMILERTLKDFNIEAKVVEVNYGPTITCYEIEPAPGIKISRIENLANDITRGLKAESVRIVAPIPGKGTVGVEVPNINRSDVLLREIIGCETYQKTKSKLKIGMGKTISGEPYVFDLIKAPHLLVAGATGSGKSVCINTLICSILFNAAPHEVKLLMIDPKQVELALYRDIPHLLSPVVTEPKKAGAALRWAVEEMETRYRYLKKAGVRNIKEYNQKRMSQQNGEIAENESTRILPGYLPYIVIFIDELADLMMVVRAEVEAMIARLAAMARAVGIHLVLATQRPSVDVLTGVIKNNFPARIAFQVSATADSRTILDMKGAESLMGRGDMLLSPGGASRPIRLQGAYISTEEAEAVVEFVKAQQEVEYVQEEFVPLDDEEGSSKKGEYDDDSDDLYDEALQCVLENDSASTSLLQRRLKIGYGRAARLLDLMEERGIVGPSRGSKPREVTMNKMR